MALLGVHFFGEPGGALYGKAWERATQRELPLVDVAWCQEAFPGHSVEQAVDRLLYQQDFLWSKGTPARPLRAAPYLRLDLRPGRTVAWDQAYFDGVGRALDRWRGRSENRLRLIVGNEFNLSSEGRVDPSDVAWVVGRVCELRDERGPESADVYAGAVGPLNRDLNPHPYKPGPSAEWLNYQHALASWIAERGYPVQGYALHAYGECVAPAPENPARPAHGAEEPALDLWCHDRPGCRAGSRAWRDLVATVEAVHPGRRYVVSEVNCNWPVWDGARWAPRYSAQNYCRGWLPRLLEELATVPAVEHAAWFAGDSPGWRHDALADREGAETPGGGCAAADDDANAVWGVA